MVSCDKGGQGGEVGRVRGGSIRNTTHGGVRVPGFFLLALCVCLHAQYLGQKAWYTHHVKILQTNFGVGEHDGGVRFDLGGDGEWLLIY
jgi:hypothetical protein